MSWLVCCVDLPWSCSAGHGEWNLQGRARYHDDDGDSPSHPSWDHRSGIAGGHPGAHTDDGSCLFSVFDVGGTPTAIDPITGTQAPVEWFLTQTGARYRFGATDTGLHIELPDACSAGRTDRAPLWPPPTRRRGRSDRSRSPPLPTGRIHLFHRGRPEVDGVGAAWRIHWRSCPTARRPRWCQPKTRLRHPTREPGHTSVLRSLGRAAAVDHRRHRRFPCLRAGGPGSDRPIASAATGWSRDRDGPRAGGGAAASWLRRTRKSVSATHCVVLVDREPDHFFPLSLLWLITGKRTARQITSPRPACQEGIEVIRSVEVIEPAARRVRIVEHGGPGTSKRSIRRCTRSGAGSETIPGLAESDTTSSRLPEPRVSATPLPISREAGSSCATAAPAYKVPGGSLRGGELILDHCRRRGNEAAVQVDLLAAELRADGRHRPRGLASGASDGRRQRCRLHPEHQVTKVTGKTITFTNGNNRRLSDLLAYVQPPHRAPRVARDSVLIGDSGLGAGRSQHSPSPDFGGVCHRRRGGDPASRWQALPKAGVFAERQAGMVASNTLMR